MSRLLKKSSLNREKYTNEQLEMIDKAISELGDDFSNVCHPNFSAEEIKEIYEKLRDFNTGYDIDSVFSSGEIDFDENSDIAHEKVWKKIQTIQEMLEESRNIDVDNRTNAFVYIDGEYYIGSTHGECINEYLYEIGEMAFSEQFKRPSIEDVERKLDEGTVMFIGHIIDDIDTVTSPFIRDEKAIYLEDSDIWVRNITLQEAVQIIKSDEDFQDYKVYIDEQWDVDVKDLKRNYQIARLIKKDIKK